MNKIKIILGYLFGFIFSVSVSLLVILLLCKFTILDKSYVKGLFVKYNYSEYIYKSIDEGMKDYMVSSGLPESILDNLYTEEDIKTELNNYLDSVYKGKEYISNREKIETKINDNINSFMKSHNLGMSDTEELASFISEITDYYDNEIRLYKVLDKFVVYVPKVSKYINTAFIVLGVTSIISLIIIIWTKFYIGSSIMSSGIILVLIRLFIFNNIDYKNILIFNEYFSKVLRYILNIYSKYILIIGISLIVGGIILSLFKNSKFFVEKK